MLLTSSVCQDGQTGYFPGTLRERSTQLLEDGRVPRHQLEEVILACRELDGAIGSYDKPACVLKHGRTLCGFEDVFAHVRLRRGVEISGDGQHVGDGVVLGVG